MLAHTSTTSAPALRAPRRRAHAATSDLRFAMAAVAHAKLVLGPWGLIFGQWEGIDEYWRHRYTTDPEIEAYHAGAMTILAQFAMVPLQVVLLGVALVVFRRAMVEVPWLLLYAIVHLTYVGGFRIEEFLWQAGSPWHDLGQAAFPVTALLAAAGAVRLARRLAGDRAR